MRVVLSTTTWWGATLEHDLRAAGMLVTTASDGEDLLACLDMVTHAPILIETDLPDRNLSGLLRQIRAAQPSAPVLAVLEAQGTCDDISVLRHGVDDVLSSTMCAEEVRARILRVTTRRAGFATPILRLGALTLDTFRRRAFWAASRLDVTPSQYEVLEHLVLHAGRVVPKDELMGVLYGVEDGADPRTLDVFLHKLRMRLQEAGAHDAVILSVKGRGLRLVCPERRKVLRARDYDWLTYLNEAA